MLRLGKPADGDGWISTVIGKVRKRAKIKRTWTVEIVLRAIFADHKPRAINCTMLFPTDAGTPMSRAFKSAWRRAMKKHLEAGNDAFARTTCAESGQRCFGSVDCAEAACAQSAATTQRHYRRGVAKSSRESELRIRQWHLY